jgi:hypothetical protein
MTRLSMYKYLFCAYHNHPRTGTAATWHCNHLALQPPRQDIQGPIAGLHAVEGSLHSTS